MEALRLSQHIYEAANVLTLYIVSDEACEDNIKVLRSVCTMPENISLRMRNMANVAPLGSHSNCLLILTAASRTCFVCQGDQNR